MTEKTLPSKKKLRKLDVPPIPEKCGDKGGVKATNSKPHQRTETRRTVKLPRLKLADLVAQVTEENAHEEISTGPAVGNEVW
jgi:hypothetical protein